VANEARKLQKMIDDWNRLGRKIEDALPLSRGGRDPNPQFPLPGPAPIRGIPTTRISAEDYQNIRWKPTPAYVDAIKSELDQVPEMDVDIALDDLRKRAEETNDQVLANAVAELTGTRPKNVRPVQIIPIQRARPSGREVIRRSGQFSRANIMPRLRPIPKTRMVKRKVSAYSKEFGKQLKKLKAKHPRTPVTRLMKKAHVATRKVRKKN